MIAVEARVLKINGKQRCGRGFSCEELKRTGLSLKEALRIGIPVDLRRRSSHEQNVDVLKGFLENWRMSSKSKGKSKS